MDNFKLCVPCLLGLECPIADELRRMKMQNVQNENGRVYFTGGAKEIAKANINLRIGERVLLELGRFRAETFDELFEKIKALPWENYIPSDGKFWVAKASSIKSKLFSPSDIQSIMKKAMVERMKKAYGIEWFPENGASFPLRVFLHKDTVTVALDTTGESLHKRGYRTLTSKAPITETLAAALIMLTPWKSDRILVDPFCGSGTFPIEAAMIALNRAPGLNRSFMAQKWACVPETVWQQARTEALDREYRGEYRILGSDIDPASLEIAQQNARKAGVGRLIEFREADATKMSLPADKGLIVCNPPYGERMLEQRSAQRLYSAFGRHLKYADGWKKYIISSEPEFEHYYGKQAVKKRKLYNGRLQCNVYMYY